MSTSLRYCLDLEEGDIPRKLVCQIRHNIKKIKYHEQYSIVPDGPFNSADVLFAHCSFEGNQQCWHCFSSDPHCPPHGPNTLYMFCIYVAMFNAVLYTSTQQLCNRVCKYICLPFCPIMSSVTLYNECLFSLVHQTLQHSICLLTYCLKKNVLYIKTI